MNYTVIIGLEVHVQLQTRTKLFCGCVNRFNPQNPNTQTCPVCLGLPGALPVMNREAFRLALKTGLALGCDISPFTKWDRKQYYYPDLPKGYQISQYDLPFSHDGFLEIETDPEAGTRKKIGIIRAHLEEDAGKNMHDESGGRRESRVDLNRAGTPLLEIVSQPDLRSPHEARAYLEELKLLLNYLDVSDCNMQEGSLRCDANVNLHVHLDDGHVAATPIVEVKNLNSFRGVEAAMHFEIERQWDQWRQSPAVSTRTGSAGAGSAAEIAGEKQTRGWDAERNVTFAQRGKEEASDYRYFPDPDLVPVTVADEELDKIRAALGEFPADRRQRLQEAYALSAYDASVIINQGRRFADYFEQVAQACGDGKPAANWCTQEVLRELNERSTSIDRFPVPSAVLGRLLEKVEKNEITNAGAREVFAELLERGHAVPGPESWSPQTVGPVERPQEAPVSSGVQVVEPLLPMIDGIIEERGLAMVSDTSELEGIIARVVDDARNERAVADFRAGKQQAIGPLIGQVMREVKGADPKLVRQMLAERISRD